MLQISCYSILFIIIFGGYILCSRNRQENELFSIRKTSTLHTSLLCLCYLAYFSYLRFSLLQRILLRGYETSYPLGQPHYTLISSSRRFQTANFHSPLNLWTSHLSTLYSHSDICEFNVHMIALLFTQPVRSLFPVLLICCDGGGHTPGRNA